MRWYLQLVVVGAILVFAAWALKGCSKSSSDFQSAREIALKQNPWKEPERKIAVTVTINKFSRQECTEAGGTFVIGDTKEVYNALVGCIEKEKP